MARTTDRASKVREIYLSLPDTKETPTWGSPHFRVGEKIFGGLGEHEDGSTSIGFKLEMEHADALVGSDPRFTRAKYVGHKGWVDMDVSAVSDWDEVRALVQESYRLIAPKRSYAKLGAAGPNVAAGATKAPAKKAPTQAPAKKATAQAPAKKTPTTKTTATKALATKTAKKSSARAKQSPAKASPAKSPSASAAKFRGRRGS